MVIGEFGDDGFDTDRDAFLDGEIICVEDLIGCAEIEESVLGGGGGIDEEE